MPPIGLGVPSELGLGVPWLCSAGVLERLICDMFGLTSPLAGSGIGDIGTVPFGSAGAETVFFYENSSFPRTQSSQMTNKKSKFIHIFILSFVREFF